MYLYQTVRFVPRYINNSISTRILRKYARTGYILYFMYHLRARYRPSTWQIPTLSRQKQAHPNAPLETIAYIELQH